MRWTIIIRFALLICFAAMAFAQGTEPKPKAEDYDVHGQSKNVSLGAEFMVHSFSGQGQTFIAGDYLVVEVALYPPKGEPIQLKMQRQGQVTIFTHDNTKVPGLYAIAPEGAPPDERVFYTVNADRTESILTAMRKWAATRESFEQRFRSARVPVQ